MTLYNVGLPQPAVPSGGTEVGQFMASPIDNYRITLGGGSEWLKGGIVVDAAPYPAAQLLQHLRAHIFTQSASAASAGACLDIATDGATTFVAVISGSPNLYVSNDNGVTWTQRAHNLAPGNATQVCWTGARFVAVGNNTTQFAAATSADGIAWVGNVFTAGLVGATADTATICGNGSVVVAQCIASAATACWTSPTGLVGTWTNRALPNAPTAVPYSAISALGIVALNVTANNIVRSLDGGVTWVSVATSAAMVNMRPIMTATSAAFVASVGSAVFYSTDLLSFGLVSMFSNGGGVGNVNALGTGGYVTSDNGTIFSYTLDGLNWNTQQRASATPGVSPTGRHCIGATAIVSLSNVGGAKPVYAISTPTKSNGIGGSGLSVTGLWRIK